MRRTSTRQRTTVRIVLEADGERDESDSYRHKWTTSGRLGQLTATGANNAAVAESLGRQLLVLANSPGAQEAVAREHEARMVLYREDVITHGRERAMARLQTRTNGGDPDASSLVDAPSPSGAIELDPRLQRWREGLPAHITDDQVAMFLRRHQPQLEAMLRQTCRHPDPINEGRPTIGLDTEGLVSMRCGDCGTRWNIRVAPLDEALETTELGAAELGELERSLKDLGLTLERKSPYHFRVLRINARRQTRTLVAEWWPSSGKTMDGLRRGQLCSTSKAFVAWLRDKEAARTGMPGKVGDPCGTCGTALEDLGAHGVGCPKCSDLEMDGLDRMLGTCETCGAALVDQGHGEECPNDCDQ